MLERNLLSLRANDSALVVHGARKRGAKAGRATHRTFRALTSMNARTE
jgi:hypothetical protein